MWTPESHRWGHNLWHCHFKPIKFPPAPLAPIFTHSQSTLGSSQRGCEQIFELCSRQTSRTSTTEEEKVPLRVPQTPQPQRTHTASPHTFPLLLFLQTNPYFCHWQPYCHSYYKGNFSSPFNLGLLSAPATSAVVANCKLCLKLQSAE